MSASQRAKGAAAEREVVRLLKDHGWPKAKRTSDGSSQRERGDVAGGPDGVHFEVRRREALNIWRSLETAELDARPAEIPVVAFRRNRTGWYAALPLEQLLALLRRWDDT